MPQLKKTMFREYDIRGKESPDELNVESIYHIVRGFSVMLAARGISQAVIGHDSRGTSEAFYQSAIKALRESGISVIEIGTVTTPMSYWAQYHVRVKGLVMITASHNPVGWNGLKLGTDFSTTLLSDEIQELYDSILHESYVWGEGSIENRDIKDAYFSDIVSRISLQKKLKVLVNTGNGTAGMYAPKLLRRFGCDVIEHFTEVDPTYPHYTPDPAGTDMMEDTGVQVRKHGCDIGVAFDGDGDRLGITDENGKVVWPDHYIALLSRTILSKYPGAKIVFDVKVSQSLPDDIRAHGGVPIMWKTGHSYIKSKLAEEKAPLAGEGSGHIFFSDFYGFDDAFYAGLTLLEYLSRHDAPLSKIVSDLPHYITTPTIHVDTTDEEKYAIVAALTDSFKKEGYAVNDINGARVSIDDGWGLVRASSNTPNLVLRFEAKKQDTLDSIQEIFREKLSKFASVSSVWNSSGH